MKKLAVFAVFLLAGCAVHHEGDKVSVRPITDRIGDWHATLASQNNSGVRGAVAARSSAVTSSASISIAGARAGAQHPWHIHRGSCGDDKGVVGGADKYPVLAVGSDGTASASATLDVALDETSSYFVNVHRSAADMGSIVACGNLAH